MESGGRLRAALEESFYNVAVTSDEMWRAVGRQLRDARLTRQWKPIDVERAGGPSYKTVQAIEQGEAGAIESLDKCARALDLSIVDILYSVLESRVRPLSPEAAQVVRKFSETTIEGRTALLAVANALQPAGEMTGMPPIPGGAATPPTPSPPRPGRPGSKRRTGG